MSGMSNIVAVAAPFIRSSARRSFGFSKAYFSDNLHINRLSEDAESDELVERSPVYSNHHVSVWQNGLVLFESLYVLELCISHA